MQLGMRGIAAAAAEGEMKAVVAMMHSDVYGLLLLFGGAH